MQQIINNKLYDTDTATLVATVTNGGAFVEALYRKNNGEFFLEKQFAPSSSLSLKPLSDSEAKEWVGINSVSHYASLFGAVTE